METKGQGSLSSSIFAPVHGRGTVRIPPAPVQAAPAVLHRVFISSLLAAVLFFPASVAYSGGEPAEHYIRTDRYTLIRSTAQGDQLDPLSTLVRVSFGPDIATVGDAIHELLEHSGYRLSYGSSENCFLAEGLLFVQPLPAPLRDIGPLPLREGLAALAGRAWEMDVSELGRTLAFRIREQYRSSAEAQRILAGGSVATAPAEQAEQRFFVPFGIAEFRFLQDDAEEVIRRAAAAVHEMDADVLVRGHSHSRGKWATRRQAVQRAKIVADALTRAGVQRERIVQDARYSNRSERREPLRHGVDILVYPNLEVDDSPRQPVPAYAALCRAAPLEREGQSAPSLQFIVEAGSLRRNIERLLHHFGLRMGRWDLADGRYEYDWKIPYAYSIRVEDPDAALRALLSSYGIQPTLNTLDSTVDFSALHSPRPHTE